MDRQTDESIMPTISYK